LTQAPGAPAPVLFTHYGEDWIRGSEQCLVDLLRHLDRDRFRPRVWCNAPTLAAEVRSLGVEVDVSPFVMLLDRSPRPGALRRWLGQVREAGRIVRHHGIRLLHANSAAPNQWLLPVARAGRIPLLVHLHVPYLARDRFALGLHQASLAVGVTHGCLEGLLEDGMPPERTRTIHNGVDPERLAAGDARELRARLGIPAGSVVLARVGSLIPRKGVDAMLRVFARLRGEGRDVHLLVLGEGPDREKLEALARGLGVAAEAHFLGHVEHLGAVLRDATDVLVSPARLEGFGLTVIEAGLSGVPVVTTDTTGMNEIVSSGRTGRVVPVDDEDALLAAVRELVEEPALRVRYAEALARVVHDRFLVSRYVEDFSRTYQELLADDPARHGWLGAWSPPSVYVRGLARALARRLGPAGGREGARPA